MTKKTFLIIFSIATALRIFWIWDPPFWYDENWSLIVSNLPWMRSWQAILGDVHPPLYYLIIRPIAQLSSIPWLIRLPSVIFSLAAIYLFWLIMIEWQVPSKVQVAALILMTVLPMQLYFAQEARMYALLEMLVLLAVYALFIKRWWLLALANILILYTQNYGLFYVATIGLLILLSGQWRKLWTCVIAGIAWLPWIGALLVQMHNIEGKYWLAQLLASPASLIYIIIQLFLGLNPPPQALIPLSWFVIFSAFILGMIFLFKERPPHWLSIFLLAFLPFALAIAASLLWQPVILFRPLIGVTPFMILIVSYPIVWILQSGDWFPACSWICKWGLSIKLRQFLFVLCFIAPVLIGNGLAYYTTIHDNKAGPHPNLTDALSYIQRMDPL